MPAKSPQNKNKKKPAKSPQIKIKNETPVVITRLYDCMRRNGLSTPNETVLLKKLAELKILSGETKTNGDQNLTEMLQIVRDVRRMLPHLSSEADYQEYISGIVKHCAEQYISMLHHDARKQIEIIDTQLHNIMGALKLLVKRKQEQEAHRGGGATEAYLRCLSDKCKLQEQAKEYRELKAQLKEVKRALTVVTKPADRIKLMIGMLNLRKRMITADPINQHAHARMILERCSKEHAAMKYHKSLRAYQALERMKR